LPVGNSDQGVGLGAGDLMVGTDINYQFIDWKHDPTVDEDFHHLGTMSSVVMTPNITIGLHDWWNLSIAQVVGRRTMTWGQDTISIHHRDESSDSDFSNAEGGVLGDSRIMLRFLALNAGRGPGMRFFLGGGMVIPSGNNITSDPFFLENPEEKDEHRHFSISEGARKAVAEVQFFLKRKTNPVFAGGTLTYESPLGENKHGYTASETFDVSLTAFTSKNRLIKGSLGGSFMVRTTTSGYWHGVEAPNSESTLLSPGIGALWNVNKTAISVNVQFPVFFSGSLVGSEAYLNEEARAVQVSVSMRKILDFYIPWL